MAKSSKATELSQRRDVYSGNIRSEETTRAPQKSVRAGASRKRRSTFNIVALLFLIAIAIVLYIGNTLKVNQLVVEVSQLQAQYERIQNANSILMAEINRKSAWERIGEVAKQQGLTHAKERPKLLDIDEERLEKFKE